MVLPSGEWVYNMWHSEIIITITVCKFFRQNYVGRSPLSGLSIHISLPPCDGFEIFARTDYRGDVVFECCRFSDKKMIATKRIVLLPGEYI